jgi:hypothetical protein
MWPFVDAKTKQKVNFETDIVGAGDVEPGELLKECGGELNVSDIDGRSLCRKIRADQRAALRS